LYTIDLDAIESYAYEGVAAAILSVPGCRMTHPPLLDWSQWKAQWLHEERIILIDMLPDEDHLVSDTSGQTFWSGCHLVCDCLVNDLMNLWLAIREKHPGVWLCDGGAYREVDSRLFSPASFLAMPNVA
jgi:hypothetical protein